MAVDRKADYVGNHGGAYVDESGQTRQFTYVDHDRNTTRLKYWKPKDYSLTPLTKEELLISDIRNSSMNNDPYFIELFDNELCTKFEMERYRKGGSVDNMMFEEEGWFQELDKIFKKAIENKIKELKKYSKNEY